MSTQEIQYVNERLAQVNERLAAIEWNLQRALAAVNLQWEQPVIDSGIPEDVVALVREGNRLEAIKRYRQHTGVSLADATAAVDAL
jgi:ribosomal protein L7/L12